MNYVRIIAITFILIFSMSAELLIVKKTESGFASLDTEESINHGKQITDILLKYQWPLCIASALTQEEQDELLSPDKPYAEEIFIQKKIQALGKEFEQYYVVFIPTALYELFLIALIFQTRGQENSLQKAVEKRLKPIAEWKIDLTGILNENESAINVREKINNYFKINNELFLNNVEAKESAYFYINNQLATLLFKHFPEFMNSTDSLQLSNDIKNNSEKLSSLLINELELLGSGSRHRFFLPGKKIANSCTIRLVDYLQNEPKTNVLNKYIALEYEARKLNKALLIRGTSFIESQVSLGTQPMKRTLAGATLMKQEYKETAQGLEEISFEEAYKKKINAPFSISFGNSLFAGTILDCTASAYHFLSGQRLIGTRFFPLKAAGYALLIDKKSYVEHQCNNLFFIPSLSTISSLLQKGEYFHPRTKAAIAKKDYKKETDIQGLMGEEIKDPTGVLFITRDPLHHAELFSKFLAKNGRIIQLGDESTFTNEEKQFVEDVKKSQLEAAQFYRAVRTITPKIQQAMKQFKKRRTAQQL